MNKYVVIIKLAFVIIIGLFISCDLIEPEDENNPPEIISLIADTAIIVQEENTLIRCEAVDPDENILHFSWETTRGTISGVGPSITYIAPLKTGNYRIICYVDDEQGGKDTASLIISVVYEFKRDTIADIDGNLYKAVRIGNQWWMAENLKVTHYNNGDAINKMSSNYNPNNQTGVYADVVNNEYYRNIYGLTYNYYAIEDERGLAPEGWHVASDYDWMELEYFLGVDPQLLDSTGSRGGIDCLPSALIMSRTGWDWDMGRDDYEFCAYPVTGYYYSLTYNEVIWNGVGMISQFWTASEKYDLNNAWYRCVSGPYIIREYFSKHNGLQVRCVKDED